LHQLRTLVQEGALLWLIPLKELKARIETVDLWSESTNDDRCDNCRYYRELSEGIAYCIHREVDMVVGAP